MTNPATKATTSIRRFCALLIFFFVVITAATVQGQVPASEPTTPLAERPWSFGLFGTGGFAWAYRFEVDNPPPATIQKMSAPLNLEVFNAGIHVGRILTSSIGPPPLRGQFELDMDLMPFWQAHYPPQALVFRSGRGTVTSATLKAENRFGVSATPLLCRWNFSGQGRFVPWAQLGGGLLWTNHKFPQYPITNADTSVINFTPQFGFGLNYFRKPRQSLFFALNAVHISSAGLGDRNPGVNVTTQFSVGYSWWK